LGTFSSNSLQQSRLIAHAPALASASVALNTSTIYLGQAVGAGVGGRIVVEHLLTWLTPVGAIFAALAIALTVAASRLDRRRGLLLPKFAECAFELGHRLEEIGDEAVIGDLEDRRFLILVDGDDDLRVLHAGQVLDGARNADRNIEIGSDDLAGLADLIVVRHEARIDRRARRANGSAELVGDLVEHMEVL